MYEMACFLRPDRAATFRAAMDRITAHVPQIQFFDVDVVVLGLLSVKMQRQVLSSPGVGVEIVQNTVEVPQLLFIDKVVVLPLLCRQRFCPDSAENRRVLPAVLGQSCGFARCGARQVRD